jgi:rubrerythrin
MTMSTLDNVRSRIFDKRFEWSRIDPVKALSNTAALDLLREACLIESYLPVYTGKMTELFWDDLEATEVYTIEAFEAYTHYYSIRRYLDTVGYRPISDAEIVELRSRERATRYTDQIRELVNFMATEQFAAGFFADLIDAVEEPVLQAMLARFAEEEVRHSQFAWDLLQKRVEQDPGIADRIVEMASQVQHVGSYILPHVSPAKDDNVKTLIEFSRRIESLTSRSLTSALLAARRETS